MVGDGRCAQPVRQGAPDHLPGRVQHRGERPVVQRLRLLWPKLLREYRPDVLIPGTSAAAPGGGGCFVLSRAKRLLHTMNRIPRPLLTLAIRLPLPKPAPA